MPGLYEVCTGLRSPLMQAGRIKGVSVRGFGLENGYNMMHKITKDKIMRLARKKTNDPE